MKVLLALAIFGLGTCFAAAQPAGKIACSQTDEGTTRDGACIYDRHDYDARYDGWTQWRITTHWTQEKCDHLYMVCDGNWHLPFDQTETYYRAGLFRPRGQDCRRIIHRN